MKYALKRDVVCLESLPIVDHIGVDGSPSGSPCSPASGCKSSNEEYLVRTSSFCLQSMLFSINVGLSFGLGSRRFC